MRSLIIPNQEKDSDSFLGLILEEVPQSEIPASGQRPGGLSNQPDLVEHRPSHYVYQMVRLRYGIADVLPAIALLVYSVVVQRYLRQQIVLGVSVLIESDGAALPEGEIGAPDAAVFGVSGDAPAEVRVSVAGSELHIEVEGGVGLGGLAGGANDGKPARDVLARGHASRRNRDGADELGSECVIVLDLELEVDDGVSQRNVEMVVPPRVLGVGDDMGAGDGGLRDDDGDVRVAGDDAAVVLLDLLVSGGMVTGVSGGASVTGGEAAAETLGSEVHVG